MSYRADRRTDADKRFTPPTVVGVSNKFNRLRSVKFCREI